MAMPEDLNMTDAFSADTQTRLYCRKWAPSPEVAVAARLVFIHGFSDHCNAYYNFFPSLAARGIEVWAFDQRGWGRSVSTEIRPGDTGSTSTVLDDISSFLIHVHSQPASPETGQVAEFVPLFLMGHSMGGAEVLLLTLLQTRQQSLPRLSGILLESPWISLHPDAQPNSLTVLAGKLASKLLPKRPLLQKLDAKNMCRDPQVCEDWEKDGLCHNTGTLEGLAGMMQRAADLTAFAKGQRVPNLGSEPVVSVGDQATDLVPIWIGHGTEDRVTSCSTSEALFTKIDVKDKTLKLYPGAYHKLHAEPHGVAEEFANDVADWILERAKLSSQPGAQKHDVRPRL